MRLRTGTVHFSADLAAWMIEDRPGDCMVAIEGIRVRFYSKNDEAAFFEWIESIGVVSDVAKTGGRLSLRVDIEKLDQEKLLELISLFARYRINIRALKCLWSPRFAGLRWKAAYWYKPLFR